MWAELLNVSCTSVVEVHHISMQVLASMFKMGMEETLDFVLELIDEDVLNKELEEYFQQSVEKVRNLINIVVRLCIFRIWRRHYKKKRKVTYKKSIYTRKMVNEFKQNSYNHSMHGSLTDLINLKINEELQEKLFNSIIRL